MSEKTANKKLFKRDNLMRYISVVCIIVLAFIFEQIQPNFLGRMNIVSMLRDNAVLLTLAVGMTSVLIFGSIDLSMGAMCSVSNVLYVRIIVMFAEKYKAAGVEDPAYVGVMLLAIICEHTMGAQLSRFLSIPGAFRSLLLLPPLLLLLPQTPRKAVRT